MNVSKKNSYISVLMLTKCKILCNLYIPEWALTKGKKKSYTLG